MGAIIKVYSRCKDHTRIDLCDTKQKATFQVSLLLLLFRNFQRLQLIPRRV